MILNIFSFATMQEIGQLKAGGERAVRNYCVSVPSLRASMDSPTTRGRKQLVPSPPNLLSLPDGTNPYSMYINVSCSSHLTYVRNQSLALEF